MSTVTVVAVGRETRTADADLPPPPHGCDSCTGCCGCGGCCGCSCQSSTPAQETSSIIL